MSSAVSCSNCLSPTSRSDAGDRTVGPACGRARRGALWVGTHSGVPGNSAAALQHRTERARPHGPRRSGPTAPVGWALDAISATDVLLRFGGATTSKSDLIVFDGVIIQRCRLFLLLLGGKDIIIQPHLFNCSNWSHSKWALPFIHNGHDSEIIFAMRSLVWWVKLQW